MAGKINRKCRWPCYAYDWIISSKQNVLLSELLQYVRLYSAIKRRNDEPAILYILKTICSIESIGHESSFKTIDCSTCSARNYNLQSKIEFGWINVDSMVALVNCINSIFFFWLTFHWAMTCVDCVKCQKKYTLTPQHAHTRKWSKGK